MIFRRGAVTAIVIATALCAGACEEDVSSVPDDVLNQKPESPPDQPDPATTRPTTQELVSGSRVPMTLDVLPLVLDVPPQWKITRQGSTGTIVWLEGPSPGGEAHVALKVQEPLLPQKFDQLLAGTKREIERPAEPGATTDMRRLGHAHVIERRSVGRSFTGSALDAKGEVIQRTIVPMLWRVNVYMPSPERVENYELKFIDLEKEQYEIDRSFLEGIIKSLRLVGDGGGTDGTTTAPAGTQPAMR